jgi:hypothetical protein
MNYVATFITDKLSSFQYGKILSFEDIWEDKSVVHGYIRCEKCKKEVNEAVLIDKKYYCFDCLAH